MIFDTERVRDIGDWYAISGISEIININDAGINKPVGINGVTGIDDVAGVGLVDYILKVLNKIVLSYLINQAGFLIF